MSKHSSAFIRIMSLLLLFSLCIGVFASCKDTEGQVTTDIEKTTTPTAATSTPTDEGTTILPTQGDDTDMYTSSDYVKKYADQSSMDNWLEDNITGKNNPPVTFQIGGKNSDSYTWQKQIGESRKVIYFETEENPSESTEQIINYICKELSIRIEFTLITYTDYPVVEYNAVLYNEADGNSARISNLMAADYKI